MIKKIKKIKNLGIFQNCMWNSSIPEFKKYNLFYGWNGSGKTTLSKLFDSLNSGKNLEYPDLEYEFEHESSSIRSTLSQEIQFQTKIRVFNKKYIEDNIEILEGKAKSIFILGAENKKLAEQLNEDEEYLKNLKEECYQIEKSILKKEEDSAKIFKNAGTTIGATNVGSAVRNYNAKHAKEDFVNLKEKQLLDEAEINEYQVILKQEQLQKLECLNYSFDLPKVYERVSEICKKTVENEVIVRLKENIDISDWVEKGINLHKLYKSKKCEFCDNHVSEARLKELTNHFNDADQRLKEEINLEIDKMSSYLSELTNLKVPDKISLYKELQTKYISRLATFNQEKTNLSFEISILIEKLKEKRSKTTESLSFKISLENNFLSSLISLNEVIKEHTDKTDNFQIQKDTATLRLKNHYLSEIFDDIKKIDQGIIQDREKIIEITNGTETKTGITELEKRISINKSTISSVHKACDELNKNLCIFLGRKEIVFEVTADSGYLLKRNGRIAKNLSEGEKMAIAFVYFIVHLQDQNFNLREGIVVIDDPISSMDSNSLFQAFAFLKNGVKEAKQIFILTHNFDFFKLIHGWFLYFDRDSKFYMIKNKYAEDKERTAIISAIDPFIAGYHSEYEYLFKILLEFNANSTEDKTIENVYNIPNIGRKVLETFLMFRIPNNKSLSTKVKQLEDEHVYDNNQLTAINKFFNDQSHITGSGFDPSLIPETEKNVKYLLNMIETLMPEHFNILKQQFNR